MCDQWRDISTAPKDMTEVIGMDEAGDVRRTWYFAPSSRTFGWRVIGRRHWWKPVWWMPLPQPPAQEADNA